MQPPASIVRIFEEKFSGCFKSAALMHGHNSLSQCPFVVLVSFENFMSWTMNNDQCNENCGHHRSFKYCPINVRQFMDRQWNIWHNYYYDAFGVQEAGRFYGASISKEWHVGANATFHNNSSLFLRLSFWPSVRCQWNDALNDDDLMIWNLISFE